MKIKLQNGIEIECELNEATEILGLTNGKKTFKQGKRERLIRKVNGKKERYCRICGDILGFHKINLCGKPACKKEAGKQRCHRYLLKRARNGGMPLNNTKARKLIPVNWA